MATLRNPTSPAGSNERSTYSIRSQLNRQQVLGGTEASSSSIATYAVTLDRQATLASEDQWVHPTIRDEDETMHDASTTHPSSAVPDGDDPYLDIDADPSLLHTAPHTTSPGIEPNLHNTSPDSPSLSTKPILVPMDET
ncbi:hypothetical protein PQX77_017708 [Marasmius sp. AFHP31]|nr:hypothetical protein PQX77_017708 [Marasmius sp. AFHP31]